MKAHAKTIAIGIVTAWAAMYLAKKFPQIGTYVR